MCYDLRRSLLLRLCQSGRNIFERGDVLINVRFRVLYGDRPLLIPPIRLRHHATVDHGKPVVAPALAM